MLPRESPPNVLIIDDELTVLMTLLTDAHDIISNAYPMDSADALNYVRAIHTGEPEELSKARSDESFQPLGRSIHTETRVDELLAACYRADVVVSDLRMPRVRPVPAGVEAGIHILTALRSRNVLTPIRVAITAHEVDDYYVKAYDQAEVFDFIVKGDEHPFLMRLQLRRAIRAAAHAQLNARNERLMSQRLATERTANEAKLIGSSAPIADMKVLMSRYSANSEAAVLITGENGSGKEVVARALHLGSPRAAKRFVVVNSAAIPGTLLEAELFGASRGAWSDLQKDRKGALETAAGGTVFLDEIGELDKSLQAKLLRVLQDGRYRRLGEDEERQAGVRFVFATNKNLIEAIGRDEFRRDLYYRINTLPIEVPPLRDHVEDIPELVAHYLAKEGRNLAVEPALLEQFKSYSWPGNVRELFGLIERMATLTEQPILRVDDLPADWNLPLFSGAEPTVFASTPEAEALKRTVLESGGDWVKHLKKPLKDRKIERGLVQQVIKSAYFEGGQVFKGGSKGGLIQALGIDPDKKTGSRTQYKAFMDWMAQNKLNPRDGRRIASPAINRAIPRDSR